MKFKKTAKQTEATRLVIDHGKSLFAGGSRSGKSALAVYLTFVRAAKCPSRHSIARQIMRDAVNKLGLDTIPTVLDLAFPDLPVKLDRSKWYWTLPNGSEVWLNGLDDAGDRDARILGSEYSTLVFDECDQMNYNSILLARTRLAQLNKLNKREIFCCNPPSTSSWVYRLFVDKVDPIDRKPIVNPDDYGLLMINPADNLKNIDPNYLSMLETLPKAQRDRFLHGLWGNDSMTVLWRREWMGDHRIDSIPVDDEGNNPFTRIVIGVDPAGSANRKSDETGIAVMAMDRYRHYYVIHSEGVKMSPEGWGRRVVELYKMWGADVCVVEKNYGGDMTRSTIHAVDPAVRVELVTASKGKSIRAEPISALYEQGMVHHVGQHDQLEDELMLFDIVNPPKDSPNIADAAIWGLSHLSGGGIISPRVSTETARRQDNEDENAKPISDMSVVELIECDELWDEI